MKLTLKNEKKAAIIEIPEATPALYDAILNRAFAFVGGLTPIQAAKAPEITIRAQALTEDGKDRIVKKLTEAVAADHRPRTLPKVNEDRTLFTTIGDKYADKLQALASGMTQAETPAEPQPEYWKTGIQIREIDGEEVPTYRTYYYCPEGHKGKRYIKEGTDYVHCHECNTKIGVRHAHEDGFPNRDGFGNFYIADQPYDDAVIDAAADSE